MRTVRLSAGTVATVLSLMGALAMAQAPASKLDTATTEGPFRGVVVSVAPTVLIAKGQADPKTVRFMVKDAKITRGGFRACELADIKKGDAVTIVYGPPKQARSKMLVASHVDLSGELLDSDKQPILAERGKLLFEDSFGRSQMPPKWRLGKGSWEVRDGTIVAAEIPDDKHAAYAYTDPGFQYKDTVAQFSFKFNGSTTCQWVMDDSKYKESHAGHIIRASIMPTQVVLADQKFGSMKNEIFEKMKDEQTSDEEKKKIQASIKDKTAVFKIALDTEKWHEARVEVVGDEMLLSIDYQPVGYFKSEGVDHPTKNHTGFTVGGKSMQLANVKVWEATPRADWAKVRADIVAGLKKP